jgi:hypothetical protein
MLGDCSWPYRKERYPNQSGINAEPIKKLPLRIYQPAPIAGKPSCLTMLVQPVVPTKDGKS